MNHTNKKNRLILFIAIISIACCVRAPITGVGSLVSTILEDLHLANGAAGMLTTIPLLAFAVISLFVGNVCKKYGAGHVMLWGLMVLAVGIVCRSYLGTAGLFLGTVIIGVGIAIGNVLMPALIKAYYPNRVGMMTSLYTTAMSILAGIAGGISVPIALSYGWRNALAIWFVLAVVALVCWFPNRKIVLENSSSEKDRSIIRSSMTWWISLFMGIQSLLFYSFVAWLATILQAKGFDAQTAGYFSSAFLLLGIPGSFIIPIIAGRTNNQSVLGVMLGIFYFLGMVILIFAAQTPLLLIALICCGFCSGACFSFSMASFGFHTNNAAAASFLSGLAQSIGYLLAAIGPAFMGKVYDITQNWAIPLSLLALLAAVLAVLGFLVGRHRMVDDR